jgi:hypothetical protein
MAFENLHVQRVVAAASDDRRGTGVLEQIHVGPSAGYGFKSSSTRPPCNG